MELTLDVQRNVLPEGKLKTRKILDGSFGGFLPMGFLPCTYKQLNRHLHGPLGFLIGLIEIYKSLCKNFSIVLLILYFYSKYIIKSHSTVKGMMTIVIL